MPKSKKYKAFAKITESPGVVAHGMSRLPRFAKYVAAAFLVSACATHQSSHVGQNTPPEPQPDEQRLLQQHCSDLPPPQAHALLQQLAQQNLQVQAAWARVRVARAQADQRAAVQLPSLQLGVQGSRSKNNPIQLGPRFPGGTFILEQVEASLAADYELDLWDRLENAANAAQFQAAAREMDTRAIAVSLSAQLLESWFDLSFQLRQRELVESQLEINRKLLELLKNRFVLGAGSALDALQQKQQLQQLQSALASNLAEIELRQNQLAVLLGRRPDARFNPLPDALPELKPLDSGWSLSASALARRPDLRSAFYLMQASDAGLAAALAQRLPSVRLSAAIFGQGVDLDGLVDGLLWRVAAAITQPIFSGGRITAQIDEARALLDAQLLDYRQAMLTGLEELSNAGISENLESTRIANLTQQLEIAERAYRLARQQFLRGAVDYLRVLDTSQSLIDVEHELLRAKRQRISFRIQFCRALGIDWTTTAQQKSR